MEYKRICNICKSDKTYRNQWYQYDHDHICKKCRNRLIDNPKWHIITNPITNKKFNKNGIWFKHKRISLKQNPRKGICLNCGRVGKTDLHHIKYHEDNPLKDTIELCRSCHMNKHRSK